VNKGGDDEDDLPPITGDATFNMDPVEFSADSTVGSPSPLKTEPFDPEPGRELIRGLLAAVLVGAFILGSLSLAIPAAVGWLEIALARDLATAFLPPLFGLASAAVGFYYGQR
jgi:hypothetical protein